MANKLFILIASLGLAACVTINIYFPAAEAQEVADQIIDDVWQLKNGEKKEGENPAPNSEDANTSEASPQSSESQ